MGKMLLYFENKSFIYILYMHLFICSLYNEDPHIVFSEALIRAPMMPRDVSLSYSHTFDRFFFSR